MTIFAKGIKFVALVRIVVSFALVLITSMLFGQESPRFSREIQIIKSRVYEFEDPSKQLCLITGSSSVRMWHDIQDQFPEKNFINTGFGGSHATDLFYYLDTVVLNFTPELIFIYEGDNDIAHHKTPREIQKTTKLILKKIHSILPSSRVVLISAKPSITRWDLKKQYTLLNKKFKRLSKKKKYVDYLDVWNCMLEEDGDLKKDLFLSDGLHMNKKGYLIWASALQHYFDR